MRIFLGDFWRHTGRLGIIISINCENCLVSRRETILSALFAPLQSRNRQRSQRRRRGCVRRGPVIVCIWMWDSQRDLIICLLYTLTIITVSRILICWTSQSLEKWCELKHRLENEFMPWKFAVIFTDSEPLYFTPGWEQHCKDEGLEHEFSSRHKHGQNGVVERAMQTVGTTFRCMMITGNARGDWWVLARPLILCLGGDWPGFGFFGIVLKMSLLSCERGEYPLGVRV